MINNKWSTEENLISINQNFFEILKRDFLTNNKPKLRLLWSFLDHFIIFLWPGRYTSRFSSFTQNLFIYCRSKRWAKIAWFSWEPSLEGLPNWLWRDDALQPMRLQRGFQVSVWNPILVNFQATVKTQDHFRQDFIRPQNLFW